MTGRLRVAAAVLAAAIGLEVFALGADGPFLSTAGALAEGIGAFVVLAMLAPGRTFWRAFAGPLLPAVLGLAWLASAALGSGDPFARAWSAPDLLASATARYAAGCAILAAAAAIGWRQRGMRMIIDAWLLLGLLQLATALALRQSDPDLVWGIDKGDLRDRFTGTFLNANAAGCLYAVLAILGGGRSIALWRNRFDPAPLLTQVVAPVALLGGTAACALTGSRTALAACLTALAIQAVWLLPRRSRRMPGVRAALVALGLGAVIVGVLSVVGGDTADRMASLDQDGLARWRIWSFYGRLVAQAPLGYGPGGLDDATLHAFRSIADAHLLWYVHSTHDVALSLLVTGGWPYLASMTALAAVLVIPAIRQASRRAEALPASLLLALATMLVCASVDLGFDMPALAAIGAMLAGLCWGRAASADHAPLLLSSLSTAGAAGDPATSPRA